VKRDHGRLNEPLVLVQPQQHIVRSRPIRALKQKSRLPGGPQLGQVFIDARRRLKPLPGENLDHEDVRDAVRFDAQLRKARYTVSLTVKWA
jgi:hypothetical protein